MPKLDKIIEYIFYIFIFFLPLETRWIFREQTLGGGFWEYGSFSLYGRDILLFLVLFLSLLSWLRDKKRSLLNNKLENFWWFVAFFELTVFLSIFWAKDLSLALYGWVRVLLGIGLFYLVKSGVKFDFRKLGMVIFYSATIQSLLGLSQFFSQKTFSNKWLGLAWHEAQELGQFVIEINNGRWLRAYGGLSHPNILAVFLIIGFWAGLGLLSLAKKRGERIWLFILEGLITAALFFTFSRSAWLAWIISLLIFWFVSWRKKIETQNFLKFTLLSLVIFLFLGWSFRDLVLPRLAGSGRLEKKSQIERMDQYQDSWRLIKNYFPLGVGINNYTFVVFKEIDSSRPYSKYQPVHNIYLLALTELGLGAGLFFLIIFQALINIFRISRNIFSRGFEEELENFKKVIPYHFSFIALLVIGFFDHYFWTLSFGQLIFWLVLGLSFKVYPHTFQKYPDGWVK